ncbi:MAG: hypothetical protein AAFQ60_05505 [Pseudomonadota bacterium]
MIVSKNEPITLIGGGQVDKTDLSLALGHATTLVAADGGADRALSFGFTPQAVIGDFDSVTEDALEQIAPENQHRIAEQDSTDFEKALRAIDAPLVIGLVLQARASITNWPRLTRFRGFQRSAACCLERMKLYSCVRPRFGLR